MLSMVSVQFLLSQTMHFSEEKYYDALEMSFYKKGEITFSKDIIKIIYENDHTILTYDRQFLVTQKGSKQKKVDILKHPEIKIFFLIFESIYLGKDKILQAYFTPIIKNGMTILSPHKNISKVIRNVQYKKTGKQLDFLKINLSNKDRIVIEEIH